MDLISQLRNDHRTSEFKHSNIIVDASSFISKLSSVYPELLTKNSPTDIAELFQRILDLLNNALSKQTLFYSPK